ncbi:MAG: DUF58 domain-containing protein [Lentisphaeria bacterium]
MILKEVRHKLQKLRISTLKQINNNFSGEYRSNFKGRGLEFHEAREYQAGDDVRSIDWNITARQGFPYIKRFHEERQLTVILAVDFSGSMQFGSRGKQKSEVMIEICALLAFSAVRNNDLVGLLIYTDCKELFIAPAKGTGHVLRILHSLLTFEPKSKGSNAFEPMGYLSRILTRSSVLFVISDFLDASYENNRPLKVLARRHDFIAISVKDPIENSVPNCGLISVCDSENSQRYICDTSSKKVRDRIMRMQIENSKRLFKNFAQAGISIISVQTDHNYMNSLQKFFRNRERRISNG